MFLGCLWFGLLNGVQPSPSSCYVCPIIHIIRRYTKKANKSTSYCFGAITKKKKKFPLYMLYVATGQRGSFEEFNFTRIVLVLIYIFILCLVRGNNNEDATAPCENHLSRSIEYLRVVLRMTTYMLMCVCCV